MSGRIKCVVWDLDDTLWQGVLLENGGSVLRERAREIVTTLDARGIVQSIASRNEPGPALARLEALGLGEYFLVPQIHWGPKSQSVAAVAETLDIALDAIAFVDDQPFERDEVARAHPSVRVIDAADLAALVTDPAFVPDVVTEDARERRARYRQAGMRKEAERRFDGPPESFLETLDLVLTIAPAQPADLDRARELTLRTHQLNATGVTYSRQELESLSRSPDHQVWVASLCDRYGDYGRIGLAVLGCACDAWTLSLLLVSCRVISRGVGSALLASVLAHAKAARVRLRADFVSTERNRIMLVTYRFAGFRIVSDEGGRMLLEHDLREIPALPKYLRIVSSVPQGTVTDARSTIASTSP